MISNWRQQAYDLLGGITGSVLFNNPVRVVRFLVRQPDGSLRDRGELPAPVRRLADTSPPPERNCLHTVQFVHHVWIPPGGRHVQELHVHPDAEELVVILAGKGRFRIGDESHAVEPGDVAYIPPDAEHELTNEGPEMLGAIFINIPVGEGLRRLLREDGEGAAPEHAAPR
jgi:mannose-6-phosphate isomerase-like protein (cupin superfamily)